MRIASLQAVHHRIAAASALAILTTAAFPSCGNAGGKAGDRCIPEEEYQQRFSGFSVGEEIAYAQVWDCSTRLCLVDRFQGRLTCPLGQPEPRRCTGPDDSSCPAAPTRLPAAAQLQPFRATLRCSIDRRLIGIILDARRAPSSITSKERLARSVV